MQHFYLILKKLKICKIFIPFADKTVMKIFNLTVNMIYSFYVAS